MFRQPIIHRPSADAFSRKGRRGQVAVEMCESPGLSPHRGSVGQVRRSAWAAGSAFTAVLPPRVNVFNALRPNLPPLMTASLRIASASALFQKDGASPSRLVGGRRSLSVPFSVLYSSLVSRPFVIPRLTKTLLGSARGWRHFGSRIASFQSLAAPLSTDSSTVEPRWTLSELRSPRIIPRLDRAISGINPRGFSRDNSAWGPARNRFRSRIRSGVAPALKAMPRS